MERDSHMTNETNSIFAKPVFGADRNREADRQKATEGFSQIFATILAKQMRQSMVGADKGPMGIGGGTSGDIYGAFFDQAMGKVLAHSSSMKPLNRMIDRQLAGPRHSTSSAHGAQAAQSLGEAKLAALDKAALLDEMRDEKAAVPTIAGMSGLATPKLLPSDARGPLLLPPAPSSAAPVLLPPSSLEG